jgi:hypothetical protein
MGKCRVVHFRKEPYDIMIDRTTKWGCPFSHIRDRKTKAKYLVNSRKEAIEAYREWITKGEGQYLLNDLHELKGKTLGCWCKDENGKGKSCHGDVLVELVNDMFRTDGFTI